MSFNSQLAKVKDAGEDFEWYPTTKEIIKVVKDDYYDFKHNCEGGYYHHSTFLDIGAGDGKVLKEFEDTASLFAIEKSRLLVESYPDSISFIGSDFWEQTLIDKQMTVVFCNPPYSEYVEWSEKIIREANSRVVYLVIPTRWANSEEIKTALVVRNAEAEILHTSDFLSSEDRQARARVDVIRITIPYTSDDPFDLFFESVFADELKEANGAKDDPYEFTRVEEEYVTSKRSVVEVLVESYNHELRKLQDNYREVCKIPVEVLLSIETSTRIVRDCLKNKLKTLKKEYWVKLFDRMDSITNKMTHTTRGKILARLNEYAGIDFTNGNCFEVICWAVKHANEYYDEQFIDTYGRLVSKSCVENYKSNQKVFNDDGWRYCHRSDRSSTHFSLDYRIVTTNCGGIFSGDYGGYDAVNGLTKHGADFLNDIMVIAGNLGYQPKDIAHNFEWTSGKSNSFMCQDLKGNEIVLLEVKAFKNGNMHFRFSQDFMLRMNVEHGRLQGWIKTPQQASEELGITQRHAKNVFGSSFKITPNNTLLLEG